MNIQRFDSSEGNVWKYVFDFGGAVAESVLYRYESFRKRTVLCISVQSGCPVGCSFCGTGKRFIRNLTIAEICEQVYSVFKDQSIDTLYPDIERLQIMFMSMGEPFLNYIRMVEAIDRLTALYPSAELLVSTIVPNKWLFLRDFLSLSCEIDKIGLQFSVHRSSNTERDKLIPYRDKLTLEELRDYGVEWWHRTGRKPFINYCVDGTNNTPQDAERLRWLFPTNVFCFTFSVVCSADETAKEAGFRSREAIEQFAALFTGYDTRIFDPARQDDIGGGYGQLWYIQRFLPERENCR